MNQYLVKYSNTIFSAFKYASVFASTTEEAKKRFKNGFPNNIYWGAQRLTFPIAVKKETSSEYLKRVKKDCKNGKHYYNYWIKTGENSGKSMGGTRVQLIARGQKTGKCIFCNAEFKPLN